MQKGWEILALFPQPVSFQIVVANQHSEKLAKSINLKTVKYMINFSINEKIFSINLLFMKIFVVLTLVFALQATASVYSQNTQISLNYEQARLGDVLSRIEKDTEFVFFYRHGAIDQNIKVDIHAQNMNIHDVLTEMFRNTGIEWTVRDRLIILGTKETNDIAVFQGIAITGTVTDNTGEPLPGVNVVVKGSMQGTATDSNGAFSINVPDANAVLSFSFVGYLTQEVTVGIQRVINVVLIEDANVIEEVIVIGYGSVKKANLTGAVGYVDSKQIENRSVASATQALQGKVAGLTITTPGGYAREEQRINIRGYTGLGATAEPLIIIDGIQAPGGSLNYIEMNDVESISFLKDAASAAIYGSSAPYGVILVTTKKGRSGKPVITYNSNFGFSSPTNLPEFRNAKEYAEMFNYARANAGGQPYFSQSVMDRIDQYMAGTLKTETQRDPSQADDWYVREFGNGNNEWFSMLFKKTAFSQRHNISASGATDNTNYYVGLGYTQQDGLLSIGYEDDKRYNGRVNVTTNLTNWLTFSAKTSFVRQFQDLPSESIWGTSGALMHMISASEPNWPFYQPTVVNGEAVPSKNYAEFGPQLRLAEGGRTQHTTDNYTITGELIMKPLPGWDITANYTYSGREYEKFNHNKLMYTEYPSGEVRVNRIITEANNLVARDWQKNRDYVINAFTSYEKSLGDHYFKGLIGFTQELRTYLQINGSRNYLLTDDLPMMSLTTPSTTAVSDAAWERAVRGGFGRIMYNFQEKYFVELNGRYDGTSKFMKDYRMKFYPGVSAAWALSKENFWDPLRSAVNIFKLRASYASLGDMNALAGNYPFYPFLTRNNINQAGPEPSSSTNWVFSGGRENYYRPPNLVDPNLTWVTTNTIDFGFDLGALNNRLEINFDWYNRRQKAYVGPTESVPVILGTNPPQTNNSELETKGWDLTIAWRDRIGEFGYGASFVINDYVGKVIKYPSNSTIVWDEDGDGGHWYAGQTQGDIWGFVTEGIIKTDEEAMRCNQTQSFINANWARGDIHYKSFQPDGILTVGEITKEDPGDLRIIGNETPRYTYGLTLNADWKGFDVSVLFQGIGKRDVAFSKWQGAFWGILGNWFGQQSVYYTAHDFWTEENQDGYLPRPNAGDGGKNLMIQSRYLQNGAYMRIKNIQLGYTFPQAFTNKISINRARLFVNVENLATFTKMMKIIDPETAAISGNAYAAKTYPLRRTWAFGINVTF